jgi:DNA mismatch repair protein MutL
VADAVREAVRAALASAGYVRADSQQQAMVPMAPRSDQTFEQSAPESLSNTESQIANEDDNGSSLGRVSDLNNLAHPAIAAAASQPRINFPSTPVQEEPDFVGRLETVIAAKSDTARDLEAIMRESLVEQTEATSVDAQLTTGTAGVPPASSGQIPASTETIPASSLPPLNSADKFTREVSVESLSHDIRPLGQLDESFIIAVDNEGLLLIDQHVAHERVLFDKYRVLEASRAPESQQLLIPETFDLTPAQAAVFDVLAEELESYGFELMRLSGRTVAIKAAPADLPAGEARNMLAELLDTVDAEKKGSARETLRDDIAASLACHAAIKVNMPLTQEKMRWLIDRLLKTSSPTTCPHGRPVILRLATRDILKGFHRI